MTETEISPTESNNVGSTNKLCLQRKRTVTSSRIPAFISRIGFPPVCTDFVYYRQPCLHNTTIPLVSNSEFVTHVCHSLHMGPPFRQFSFPVCNSKYLRCIPGIIPKAIHKYMYPLADIADFVLQTYISEMSFPGEFVFCFGNNKFRMKMTSQEFHVFSVLYSSCLLYTSRCV